MVARHPFGVDQRTGVWKAEPGVWRPHGHSNAWRSRQPSLSEGPKIRLARWNGGAMKSLRVCRVTAYPQDFGSLWWANRQSVQLRDGTYMPNLVCER